MAILNVNLSNAKPTTLPQGTAPRGVFKFTIDETEVVDNTNNDGQRVQMQVSFVEGSDPAGVGGSYPLSLFVPRGLPAPGDNASKEEKAEYRKDQSTHNKFLAFGMHVLGYKEEQLKNPKGVRIDTDKWNTKQGWVFSTGAPEGGGFSDLFVISEPEAKAIMAGEKKVDHITARVSDDRGGKGGKGSQKGGKAAANIEDDLENVGGDAGAAASSKKAGSTGGGKAAGGQKGGGDLAEVDL